MHAQVDALRLRRLQIECEQVVGLAELPTVERVGVAGSPGQAIAALGRRDEELDVIQRRIGQFQQPAPRAVGHLGTVGQVQPQPEGRARVAGIEHRPLVGREPFVRQGTHLGDVGLSAGVLEHLQMVAERQTTDMLVEFDRHGGRRQQAEQEDEQQQTSHEASRRAGRTTGCDISAAVIKVESRKTRRDGRTFFATR